MNGAIFMRATFFSLMLLGIHLAFIGAVVAAPAIPVDYEAYPHLNDTEYLDGQSYAVEAYSLWGRDYFALANGNSGLHIFQIVGGEVVAEGIGDPVGPARDVVVKDWHAFVATASGLSAINVAVPANPTRTGFLNLTGEPVQMAVSGSRAFLACGSGGLVVVDISDPANMSVTGNYGADVRAVGADGDRLGIIIQQRFELLEISGPGNPVLLGALELGTHFWGGVSSVLQGDLAYVSKGEFLKQLDIADPGSIFESRDLTQASYSIHTRLRIQGDELVSAAANNLVFMDFATGSVKRESSQAGSIRDAAFIAGKIMCASDDRFMVFEDGLHFNPVSFVVDTNELMNPRGIVLGDVLYGLSRTADNTLMAIELGAGEEPLWTLSLNANANRAWGMAHRENTVVTLSATGALSVITVSKYGAVLRGTLELSGGFFTPFIEDRTVVFLDDQTFVVLDQRYPALENREFRVVDISNPEIPIQIGQHSLTLSSVDHVMLAGTMLVFSSRSGYEVFDAQDRLAIRSLAVHDVGTGSYARQNHVYAFHRSPESDFGEIGPERLDTWDISNPLAPVLIDQMNLNSTGILLFEGDYAYQAKSGLILDLSDPTGPVKAGNFSQPTERAYYPTMVVAGPEYLVVESRTYGTYPDTYINYSAAPGATGAISSVEDDLQPAAARLELRAVPNPFNPRVTLSFEMPAPALAQVKIFDLRGRLVADLGEKFRETGPQKVTWDGRDRQGRHMPSGVFLARVESRLGMASKKIVLAR